MTHTPKPSTPSRLAASTTGPRVFRFVCTEDRDDFITHHFPQRTCTNLPGIYELPDGGSIAVSDLGIVHTPAASKTDVQVLDSSDVATILASLRLFQRTYEDKDADAIANDWPEHFEAEMDAESAADPEPLGTEDIDDLCERINCADVLTFTQTQNLVPKPESASDHSTHTRTYIRGCQDCLREAREFTRLHDSPVRPKPYGFDLSAVQVLDKGPHEPAPRYSVEATASDPNDTSKAASVNVAQCFTGEMAALVASALRFYLDERKHAGEPI